MSVFSKLDNNALKEPMFFGNPVNVARYDQQKYEIFSKLTEKQLSFFWRPDEIDLAKDRADYQSLSDSEKHIFISNLKYQILLDSVQGRAPSLALAPVSSLPELETWINTWNFSETIHAQSYTHIIRNIVTDPGVIFDTIVVNEEILKRADSISRYYDDLIKYTELYNLFGEGTHRLNGEDVVVDLKCLKKKLYLCLVCVNILEGIRFYVSFACSFAFAERKLMVGNAKVISLIARDEALHLTGTQHIINLLSRGADDQDFARIAKECTKEVEKLFEDAAQQEKDWADYLFKDGSMIGLNREILHRYIEYITNERAKAISVKLPFEVTKNPIPWINQWLQSDNVQVAPQELEITSYLVGQIDSNILETDFNTFEL